MSKNKKYAKLSTSSRDGNKWMKTPYEVNDMEGADLQPSSSSSRRDFLKAMGFTIGFAGLAGCEIPIRKAIPHLVKPEELTPGKSQYYASTYYDGHDYCSILVKNREGRPIKIESNKLSPVSRGGTNARVQASLLNLYDSNRIKTPLKNKQEISWEEVDKEIAEKLNEISASGKKTIILSSSVISPTTKQVFKEFHHVFRNSEVVYYDAISYSGILEANAKLFGKECLPSYRFDKARLIVSFGADFLGTWLSPIEFSSQHAAGRKVSKGKYDMTKHVQFESTMSLSGSNADYRIPIEPSQEGVILLNIYNYLAEKTGMLAMNCPKSKVSIESLAGEIWNNRKQSLVVSGSNDVNIQLLVNMINRMVNSYGNTIELNAANKTKQGVDSKMERLIVELNKGAVGAVLLYGVNPAYDYFDNSAFNSAIGKAKLTVSFSDRPDETMQSVHYVCPDPNYLESWNDAEPVEGSLSLTQPVINKLFNHRQMQDSLLTWAGIEIDYYTFLQNYWEENYFPKQSRYTSFRKFWDHSVHDGVVQLPIDNSGESNDYNSGNAGEINMNDVASSVVKSDENEIEFTLYENIGIGNGGHANNPWLQELPDPISKVCWDNYLAVSKRFAVKYNLKLGDLVMIDSKFELPVLIQPGQADNTVSIALGYGRTSAGKAGNYVGQNAFNLVKYSGTRKYGGNNVKLIPTGKNYILALSQTYHQMMGRELVRDTNIKDYQANPSAGNEKHIKAEKHKTTLYKEPTIKGHHWGLAIDLGACTGCSACVISCQVENNVAVIGRDEVIRKRIMHWIRIDRYYSDESNNPDVYFQPVMCQHCDNAPCENVCPVAATQHSTEGLNQMTYNRCIGTKYCMNNCPYKVRRFNWYQYVNNDKFDYNMNDELGKMVLNPDVVVRSRGVVEKCSFCVQRIQEKKLLAKTENRGLNDGELTPACMDACPAGAMAFGDLNDPDSEISKAYRDERNYHLLEELHTLPTVGYLTKVRNRS